MRTLRTLGLLLAVLFASRAARADDTKPPNISDVKAAVKGGSVAIEAKITDDTGVLNASCFHRKPGGKWEESAMVKNEFDDIFKVNFSGGGDTEYYLQSTDILGNGPSSYGAAGKPMALGGKPSKSTAQASAEPPPPPPPHEDRPPQHKHEHPAKVAAKSAAPPKIMHRKPTTQLPDGQDVPLRIKIDSEVGIRNAVMFVRPAGTAGYKAKIPLANSGGDQFTVTIPGSVAHGDLEYFLMADDNEGRKANGGDGDETTWFKISFKAPGAGAGAAAASAGPTQPFYVAGGSLARAEPRKPILLRAQVSPGNLADVTEANADAAEAAVQGLSVKLLWREKDGEDQEAEMTPDNSGGLGGYSAMLSPMLDGTVIYYQVVACSADGSKCAIDTGSKKKWDPLLVSGAPGEPVPPLDAASSKAPAGLPE